MGFLRQLVSYAKLRLGGVETGFALYSKTHPSMMIDMEIMTDQKAPFRFSDSACQSVWALWVRVVGPLLLR